MKIAFVSMYATELSARTPLESGLGGSESALCYLSVELARLGHDITVFNNTSCSHTADKVAFADKSGATTEILNAFDAIIVVNAAIGSEFRNSFRIRKPLIFWNHHAADQPAVETLKNFEEQQSWDGIAFVSKWQLDQFKKRFNIPEAKCRVMRNAVSPAFLASEPPTPWYLTNSPPELIYTSTPFRGLDVLLDAFPEIRSSFPGARLKVFSSMGVYQVRPEDDVYKDLYLRCRDMNGVDYFGSLGQRSLAEAASGAAALAYPCTFAETSCIAALEAMALGAAVISTDLGALSETTNNFAHLTTAEPLNGDIFADFAIETLKQLRANPDKAHESRLRQLSYIKKSWHWANRALEWENWLEALQHRTAGAIPQTGRNISQLTLLGDTTEHKRHSVCLNMIVKNEAHVIKRCLDSVRPFIQSWVIVDTGSTDGTQALIRDHFKDVPGKLFESPWVNFGHNRSEALALARDQADYTFVIDADDELRFEPGFVQPDCTADAYSILIEDGATVYRRTCLFANRLAWRYVGVLHEYPEAEAKRVDLPLDGLKIVRRIEGDRSRGSQIEKYRRDATVLEKGLRDEPDNERYTFYLAQSYRDAGELRKSLDTYERRAQMGGWDEEVWYSLFEIAKLSERLQLPAERVTQRYLEAYQARPSRAEPLVALARIFREQSKFALAHLFASKAKEMPKPSDILFLDSSAYDWRALDEYAVASYWIGDYKACEQACETLLASCPIPFDQLSRVHQNLNFALAKLGKQRK